MTVLPAAGTAFDAHVPVLIVGAGAAGHVAALACRDAGTECAMLERDAIPQGSTALSSGLVPAAGTSFQRAKGIDDDPARFAADIRRKAKDEADPDLIDALATGIGPTVEWLAARHGVPSMSSRVSSIPATTAMRMHGTPRRTGSELMAALVRAAEAAGAATLANAHVTDCSPIPTGRSAESRSSGRTGPASASAAARLCSRATGSAAIPKWMQMAAGAGIERRTVRVRTDRGGRNLVARAEARIEQVLHAQPIGGCDVVVEALRLQPDRFFHTRPNHARSSKMASVNSGLLRAVSISSIRSRNRPPMRSAHCAV